MRRFCAGTRLCTGRLPTIGSRVSFLLYVLPFLSAAKRKARVGRARSLPFDSDESIREWNAGRLPVALVSPASAGHGLNLQSGGNIMVWFGLTFSLELYQQTVARLWRQGQKSETVTIEHIVTEGTVDEHILDVIEGKESSQNALMKAVKAELSRR